ncbi:MAG: hypothetical protein CL844_05640 [Crocinitomicaceae bacterium]|nr:hypothetical protein [Crocinitomicaceae bacterium]
MVLKKLQHVAVARNFLLPRRPLLRQKIGGVWRAERERRRGRVVVQAIRPRVPLLVLLPSHPERLVLVGRDERGDPGDVHPNAGPPGLVDSEQLEHPPFVAAEVTDHETGRQHTKLSRLFVGEPQPEPVPRDVHEKLRRVGRWVVAPLLADFQPLVPVIDRAEGGPPAPLHFLAEEPAHLVHQATSAHHLLRNASLDEEGPHDGGVVGVLRVWLLRLKRLQVALLAGLVKRLAPLCVLSQPRRSTRLQLCVPLYTREARQDVRPVGHEALRVEPLVQRPPVLVPDRLARQRVGRRALAARAPLVPLPQRFGAVELVLERAVRLQDLDAKRVPPLLRLGVAPERLLRDRLLGALAIELVDLLLAERVKLARAGQAEPVERGERHENGCFNTHAPARTLCLLLAGFAVGVVGRHLRRLRLQLCVHLLLVLVRPVHNLRSPVFLQGCAYPAQKRFVYGIALGLRQDADAFHQRLSPPLLKLLHNREAFVKLAPLPRSAPRLDLRPVPAQIAHVFPPRVVQHVDEVVDGNGQRGVVDGPLPCQFEVLFRLLLRQRDRAVGV